MSMILGPNGKEPFFVFLFVDRRLMSTQIPSKST